MGKPDAGKNNERKKYRRRKGKRLPKRLDLVTENAAGIDIGSREHYVCVPEDRDEEPVQVFGCFTPDLERMAEWLKSCGIETVAMESTGVYWIPVYRVLEKHGLEVQLVDARHVKYVPGRKTDVLDCQWIQQLHTYGLLKSAFVPDKSIDGLRSLWRHRKQLVQSCSREILHIQKAMTQMNLHLHVVLSDITGVTGMKIIRAIVDGERDPVVLARMRQRQVKSSEQEIAKALTGHYTDEYMFALRQALELFDVYQGKLADCDREIERHMSRFETKGTAEELAAKPRKKNKGKRRKNEPYFDLRSELFRIAGVDLTLISGIDAMTAMTIITEAGTDMGRFPNGKHFASWLGLCPNNKVTGGHVKSSKTRKVRNRAADALRVAAQSLSRSNTYLGAHHRRKKAAIGAAKATTATAHKLARIVYHMLTYGEDYVDKGQEQEQKQYQERAKRNLVKRARAMGYELVAVETGELVS